MVDRIKYSATGLQGGQAGAIGQFQLDGEDAQPKTVIWLQPDSLVSMNPPGGGGFGDPLQRCTEQVLNDVIMGYVSIDSARTQYGVVVNFTGQTTDLVRPPEDYQVDLEATEEARRQIRNMKEPS